MPSFFFYCYEGYHHPNCYQCYVIYCQNNEKELTTIIITSIKCIVTHLSDYRWGLDW
jgi:hypothetical protein